MVAVAGYPGGGIKRSKKVRAESAEQARRIFSSAISDFSSIKVLRVYDDNCKNCKKK
jgi:hypothetical protein